MPRRRPLRLAPELAARQLTLRDRVIRTAFLTRRLVRKCDEFLAGPDAARNPEGAAEVGQLRGLALQALGALQGDLAPPGGA